MEIKLPLNAQSQMALARIKDSPLALKVGQIIDVKVLQIKQDTRTLTLELANQTLRVQSDQPLTLAGGDTLKLEVMRLIPSLEFKVVNQVQDTTHPLQSSSPKQPQSESILLKVPVPQGQRIAFHHHFTASLYHTSSFSSFVQGFFSSLMG